MVHCFLFKLYLTTALLSIMPFASTASEQPAEATDVPLDQPSVTADAPQLAPDQPPPETPVIQLYDAPGQALPQQPQGPVISVETVAPAPAQQVQPSADAPASSQLTWPNTTEMREDQATLAPAAANVAIKEISEQTATVIKTMDTAVTEMTTTQQDLYAKLYTLNDTIDDAIQNAQKAIGAVTEIFNQTDKLKD